MESADVVNSNSLKSLATLIDSEFDYNTTLKTYIDKMKTLTDDPFSYEGHLTRERIGHLIQEIINNKNDSTFKSKKYILSNKEIDVAVLNGEKILVFANTCIQILPWEDCFDVFVELHRQMYHAGYYKMKEILDKHYFVTKTYIYIFLQSCNACGSYRTMKANYLFENDKERLDMENDVPAALYKQLAPGTTLRNEKLKFNDTIKIDFISMVSTPDREFKHILIYHDTATQYTLLRPLIEMDKVEIAMEIFRIITDYGPPIRIEASEVRLLEVVIKLVKIAPIDFNCSVTPVYDVRQRELIEDYIKKWMIHSKSSNWATGCYIVQCYMNLRGNINPASELFGHNVIKKASVSQYKQNYLWKIFMELKDTDVKDVDVTEEGIDVLKKDVGTSTSHTNTSTSAESATSNTESDFETCCCCKRSIYFDVYTCIVCKKFFHLFCAFKNTSNVLTGNLSILCSQCQTSYEAQITV
ncbi:unnamed protein product [Euphydryas editha]|uniref:Zinc finger PHD-type domain-containing protein n=1 Tax=Euphydryas editha TaxID=104508 RepID=A0AAU9UHU0_EUPED|nr:unnamed protein product [Euphydryas editha]